ncbi:DNA-formamidopyrimidine glycosylase [Mycoplasmoides alvi]|uniref:DNA-formamidopyrimidine glycosylase n=1 Tax=Mycoplasmoides alvi TaxID=78580 RepID=UPI00051ADDA7|nr:DNA-formamidopyrimidine glycosylase [Mycoplasmoides alvi]
MPELPEVQTVINELSKCILNKKILNIIILNKKIIKNSNQNEFKKYLIGEKFLNISRLGKYIIFHFTNDKILVSHLRMEGKYYFDKKNDIYDTKHVLIRFIFDKEELRYHDTRRFGTLNIYKKNDYLLSKELSKIALDPLDSKFNANYLLNKIKNSKKFIKTTLLDQTKVSGIGNIYADEILFASNLHPMTLAKNLNLSKVKLIVKNAKKILLWAIKCNGTTIASYKFKKGHIGSFQLHLKVHTKTNKPCSKCNTIIQKIKVNGRGTYYCPKCQVL